jgi:hypothetical protein
MNSRSRACRHSCNSPHRWTWASTLRCWLACQLVQIAWTCSHGPRLRPPRHLWSWLRNLPPRHGGPCRRCTAYVSRHAHCVCSTTSPQYEVSPNNINLFATSTSPASCKSHQHQTQASDMENPGIPLKTKSISRGERNAEGRRTEVQHQVARSCKR